MKTDQEINALVAEHVAGWKLTTVYCGVDGSSWPQLVPPGGRLDAEVPDYVNSADAVLELLMKEEWFCDCSDRIPQVTVWDADNRQHITSATSFARAAALSLLKSKGVGYE